jgi:Na+/melibiose symporter-like transporter
LSPELHLPVFLAAFGALQILLTFWTYRTSSSVPTALLVALLPPVGIPYQLWQLRSRLFDNHIAGAITYLALISACFGFYFLMPKDETPWMLIHTMALFAFLGTANVIGTSLKD